MREKTKKLIVTFHTTAAAMSMEKHCAREGIAGRLIPTPRALSADCGISWCAPVEAREQIEALLARCIPDTDEVHELLL